MRRLTPLKRSHKGGGEAFALASASAQADSVKIDFRNQSKEIMSGLSLPKKSLTCPAGHAADWRYSRKISLSRTLVLVMLAGCFLRFEICRRHRDQLEIRSTRISEAPRKKD